MPHDDPDSAAHHVMVRDQLESMLDDPQLAADAHYVLWEVCQACGDVDMALSHLEAAIRLGPVRTRPSAKVPVRSVLAIATPGDFQANLPVGMLLRQDTLLHVFWLSDPEAVLADPLGALPATLPEVDCVFITIAEDRSHAAALRAADALAAALGCATINRGAGIGRLSRDGAARLLADLPDALVPAQRLLDRGDLIGAPPAWPFIIRPLASHAGRALARIGSAGGLAAYLADTADAGPFYTAPFVDFRGEDGWFRKYRIVFVDRIPYPVHLAIHDDWRVWYYNAGMDRHVWKRLEEERFMADMPASLGARAMSALLEIGRRVDLDYVGLDCAVLADGRLLVFEVETGMIVHDNDPAELFPYKKRFVPRIFAAIEDMIDRRVAAVRDAGSLSVR